MLSRPVAVRIVVVLLAGAAIAWLLHWYSEEQPASGGEPPASDVLSALHRDGYITYVRYTDLTLGPWLARTEAWIDFDNDQMRRWTVQATDSSENPFVYHSVRHAGRVYGLPSLFAVDADSDLSDTSTVLVRRDSEVRSWLLAGDEPVAFIFSGQPTVTESDEWGVRAKGFRWQASPSVSAQDLHSQACGDDVQQAQYFYEYLTDTEGAPLGEVLLADCDGEERGLGAVMYHEIRFVDPDDLPPDFFEPEAVRDELVADEMSAFTARFGTPYWLGFEVGSYVLADVENCGIRCLEMQYVSSDYPETAFRGLSLRIGGRTRCESGQSLESEVARARLCSPDEPTAGLDAAQWVEWDPADFPVSLTQESYGDLLPSEELIAIAQNLRPYDGPTASGKPPILTMEQAREFVADALDVVCGDQRATIREYRDSADFEYDPITGEWRGQFGPLGKWMVTDPGDTVAWPLATRWLVEEEGGSYAAGYAPCGLEPRYADDVAAAQRVKPGEILARLKSYRYRVVVRNGYEDGDEDDTIYYYDGSYVFPDRAEVRTQTTVGGAAPQDATVTVIVGNRSWVGSDDGWQEERGRGAPEDYGPADHLSRFEVDLQGIEPVLDVANGVPSLRYDFDASDVIEDGGISSQTRVLVRYASSFQGQLWLAEEEGWPVRLVMSGSDENGGRVFSFEYSLDIFDTNDPSITIEPLVP